MKKLSKLQSKIVRTSFVITLIGCILFLAPPVLAAGTSKKKKEKATKVLKIFTSKDGKMSFVIGFHKTLKGKNYYFMLMIRQSITSKEFKANFTPLMKKTDTFLSKLLKVKVGSLSYFPVKHQNKQSYHLQLWAVSKKKKTTKKKINKVLHF